MALSMTTTIEQIRALVATVTGITRTGSSAAYGATGLPDAIPHGDFPAAMVYPGGTLKYILDSGGHRHTYEVLVHVMCNAGKNLDETAAQASPLVDAIIEKFAVNVTLGGRANSCIFVRQSGLMTLTYAGQDYPGWEITLEVSEQAPATPATGS